MAKGDGDGSYQKLVGHIYITKTGYEINKYIEYNKKVSFSVGLLQKLLQIVRSALYKYDNNMYGQSSIDFRATTAYTYFWESSVLNNTFHLSDTGIYPQNKEDKGNGFSLRSVAK